MSEHVTAEELRVDQDDLLSSERRRILASHLLQGCETCREAVARSCFPQSSGERLPPKVEVAYDTVLDRIVDFARRAEALPPGEREVFQTSLSRLASGQGVLSLARDGDVLVQGLGVYEAFLARSWAVRFDDPQQMCHLARSAVEVAKAFDPRIYGLQQVSDLLARAWGELGNAYRVADNLPASARAFGQALAFCKAGTGDQRLETRILELEASLFGAQREFDMVSSRLEVVANLYREIGETHLASRTLITRALYVLYSGKPEEALRLNREALASINVSREPELVALATYNELLFLTDSGRFREAKRLLFDNRRRFLEFGQVAALKLRAIEGRISYGLKQWKSAEIAFREAKTGFDGLDLDFASALASLELGMPLMRQERIDEAEQEVVRAAAVFLSLNIHREILGCAIALEEAFRMRKASVELLEDTVSFIRRRAMELGIG